MYNLLIHSKYIACFIPIDNRENDKRRGERNSFDHVLNFSLPLILQRNSIKFIKCMPQETNNIPLLVGWKLKDNIVIRIMRIFRIKKHLKTKLIFFLRRFRRRIFFSTRIPRIVPSLPPLVTKFHPQSPTTYFSPSSRSLQRSLRTPYFFPSQRISSSTLFILPSISPFLHSIFFLFLFSIQRFR